ncbi:S8 family serine peptidase [Phytomonospora sp. NPDC050363]|uniref:S8 family serine peptidase n=1 Tax=Phytomonospora sp. NPDC050363 TaxID=3155642 RepID=UPI0033E886AA
MRTRPALAFLAALALAGAGPEAAVAEPPASSARADAAPSAGPGVPVHLVTGDTVHLYPDGSVGYRAGEGREEVGYSRVFADDGSGEVFVIPADAAAGLREGWLDRRLFNVTRLAADGLGRDTTLPLIVAGDGSAARRAGVETVTATLGSIGAEAVTVSTEGGRWWSSLVSGSRAGVEHVWLDGKARVTLDVSVPQVGAPQAWDAGYTGAGVTVAVLDSGYDPGHPDLAGRVSEVADFTGTSPEAVDGHGHGTHVASIVAGDGSASSGGYKGVAPEAELLIGKVCDDFGACDDSRVIEGMEWAAANGAAAANLSVGGYPSDGTDPLAMAVNEITGRTGMLIVVSAGNYGVPGSISTPGSADAALTVGSVSKQDTLSDFSSQGPRWGDHAVKPDIAAPGGGITAARAEGTALGTPVDDFYSTESGTSMAAPHVAGAAALLKQAHPAWTAAELKAGLMGSAHPVEGLSVYQQGTGRLDALRAVTQPLSVSQGSVSFGLFPWTHTGPDPARTITYANDSGTALSVNLSVSGTGTTIPAGLLTLDKTAVTIPANGTATVTVTLHPSVREVLGNISAALVATDGVSTARTALGLVLEPELYTLKVISKARPGDTVDGADAAWANLDTGETGYFSDWTDPSVGIQRVKPGRYQVFGVVRTSGPQNRVTVFDTRVTVAGGDKNTVWDTAKGTRPKITLDRAAVLSETNVTLSHGEASIGMNAAADSVVYVAPTGSAPATSLYYSYQPVLHVLSGGVAKHVYTLYFPHTGKLPSAPAYTVKDRELSRERAIFHAQGTANIEGSRLNQVEDSPDGLAGFASITEVPWPSERIEFFTVREGLTWGGFAFVGDGQQYEQLFWAGERTLTPQTVHWNAAPLGAGVGGWENSGGAWLHHGGHLAIWMPMFTGSDQRVRSNYEGPMATGTTSLLDPHGMEVLATEQPCLGGVVVDTMAHGLYTLDCVAERDVPWSVLGTRTTATWKFAVMEHHRMDGTPVGLNAVRIDSPTMRDGFVSRAHRQDLTLDVYRQPGTAPTAATRLRFEVSYDDGATWKTVTVSRVGDHATASLNHPAGADFVSTRVSATDANGASVTATTIRAWGLE